MFPETITTGSGIERKDAAGRLSQGYGQAFRQICWELGRREDFLDIKDTDVWCSQEIA